MNDADFLKCTAEIRQIHFPRYEELPNLDLYSDQVIRYLNDLLKPLQSDSETPMITTAMVNNYVRMHLIQPTHKKRYDRSHIAYLFVICIFKQLYTIDEIRSMIQIQHQLFDESTSYDYLCTELENALQHAFSLKNDTARDTTVTNKEERLFVRATCIAFANRLLAVKYLQYKNL